MVNNMNIDNKIVLVHSLQAFERMNRSNVFQAYLIGRKQDNGFIFVEKNRFNGMTGTYTQEGWEKLVEQTKSFYKIPDDLEDMTREQLLGQIMHLRNRVSQLEERNTEMSWRLNPDRMGGQFTEEEKNRTGWL